MQLESAFTEYQTKQRIKGLIADVNIGVEKNAPTFLSVTGNFFGGIWDGAKDTVSSIWNMISHPIKTVKDIGNAVIHPVETGKAIYSSVKTVVEEDLINGNADTRARFAGRAVFEIVAVVVGTKGLDKISKVDKVSDAARLSNYIDEVVRYADKAEDITPKINLQLFGKGTTKTKHLWGKWSDYDKVTIDGREYAKIGDKYYTRHAVDRMQPSGMRYSVKGSVDGGKVGASRIYDVEQIDYGRSISPNFVEDVINNGKLIDTPVVNGVQRQIYQSGSVQVVTEGDIIITIMTK